MSPFALWLDAAVGPPWSGLVLLAIMGCFSGCSTYVAIKIVDHIYRDKP